MGFVINRHATYVYDCVVDCDLIAQVSVTEAFAFMDWGWFGWGMTGKGRHKQVEAYPENMGRRFILSTTVHPDLEAAARSPELEDSGSNLAVREVMNLKLQLEAEQACKKDRDEKRKAFLRNLPAKISSKMCGPDSCCPSLGGAKDCSENVNPWQIHKTLKNMLKKQDGAVAELAFAPCVIGFEKGSNFLRSPPHAQSRELDVRACLERFGDKSKTGFPIGSSLSADEHCFLPHIMKYLLAHRWADRDSALERPEKKIEMINKAGEDQQRIREASNTFTSEQWLEGVEDAIVLTKQQTTEDKVNAVLSEFVFGQYVLTQQIVDGKRGSLDDEVYSLDVIFGFYRVQSQNEFHAISKVLEGIEERENAVKEGGIMTLGSRICFVEVASTCYWVV